MPEEWGRRAPFSTDFRLPFRRHRPSQVSKKMPRTYGDYREMLKEKDLDLVLDYEMWTGPAPMRPYNRLVHPRGWRAFMQYGNGITGDMCIHMLDMVRWMLELDWPKRISSTG